MSAERHFDTGTVFQSRPKKLAALMEAGGDRAHLWRPDELAAIFRHQMSAPIVVDLGGYDPAAASRLKTLGEAQSLVLKSFSDLFHHPSPPLELLQLTKNFAKANLDHPESSIPNEIASALYYTSIATALVRLDTRITQLNDVDLRRGLIWTEDQPWTDGPTKELLQQALAKLSPPAKEGSAK